MKALASTESFQLLCKSTGKWGMFLSFSAPEDELMELSKAAPYLNENLENYYQIMVEDSCILLFDTEEEMEGHYNQTVGDDGPTKLNSYNGHTRVYALTCNPEGQLLTENT